MPDLPSSRPANKLVGLEAFRFVAAFAVVIWHYQHFTYVADAPVGLVRSALPLYGLLQPFYEHGVYGVWIFWCISGFIFFWKYRDAIGDHVIDGPKFAVLRLSRLYPLHVVTLVLVALLQSLYYPQHGYFYVYQHNDLYHFVLQLFLASAWGFQAGDSFNGPIWSISVEILVYFVFFSLLRHVSRSVLINIVFILLSFLLHGQLFSCLAFFYAGGLAAIARKKLPTASRTMAELIAWLILVAIIATAVMLHADFENNDSILLLTCTPVLLFCISRDYALPARCHRLIEAAGNMTYSSYLLHFPIQLAIALAFSMLGKAIPYRDPSFFVLFVGTVLVAAYATYVLFEAPAQDFIRQRFMPGRRPAPDELLAPETGR